MFLEVLRQVSTRHPLRNNLERIHRHANERDYVRVTESFQRNGQVDGLLQLPRISMSGRGEDMEYQM